MAAYAEIFLDQGNYFSTTLNVTDVNGDPLNLSGYTVSGQIRRSYYSSNVTASFTSSVSDANNGILLLQLNSATTANIAPYRYVYDVVVTETATGNKTRVVEGILSVTPSVTK